ncbi:hypothetical protein P872_15630 [Rhodonellum psychrophilum GCM71 = DSM 17998]|uniref:Uncharacterized protein n=1 Tax=Rhodonellum psychrophilum GCM71 = DSM 17998 TaxID=1123057 RepID=U5C7M8_9BACT|nr:hypothetical protein P872_15630 [Rhodonellum psychrophilum GCM71 = DSM 17998]
MFFKKNLFLIMPNCGSDIFFKEMGRQAEEIQDSEFSKVHWQSSGHPLSCFRQIN